MYPTMKISEGTGMKELGKIYVICNVKYVALTCQSRKCFIIMLKISITVPFVGLFSPFF